jgi:plasmid stabilization system protein ParE
MSRYLLTESASDDLREIAAYLAEQVGEETALRIEDGLFAKFASLAEYPGQGHSRADLTSLPLLFFSVDPYLIVYQSDASRVVIHAIFHGARDVKRHLKQRRV